MNQKVSIVIPTYNREQKLSSLLQSIELSTYKNLEIVIVDDSSDFDILHLINKFKQQNVVLLRNEQKKYVASCRNLGLKSATGDLIFLIDDDNVLDHNCIEFLVRSFDENPDCIMAGPIMYYFSEQTKLWWAGTRRNMSTSRTRFIGISLPIPKQKTWETDDFPNAWMFKKTVVEKGVFFDESLVMHYEESDFAYRVKHALKGNFYVVSDAILYHDINWSDPADLRRRWLDLSRITNTGRNRIIFHRRYSSKAQYLGFIYFWNWVFVMYYSIFILRLPFALKDRLAVINAYWSGVRKGIFHA